MKYVKWFFIGLKAVIAIALLAFFGTMGVLTIRDGKWSIGVLMILVGLVYTYGLYNLENS